MRGPYLLRPLQVDISVPDRVGGVYCLAKKPKEIAIVARAERNLREAIKAHWKEYEFFWYEPALSPREAYINQCYLYHRYAECGTLEHNEHPKPPDKTEVKCPICGV
ncbi:MAG: hypothetical protein K6T77_01950 [candidate division WOR-3 bacterium]|nr:hypothetical protein [candidate division WOR-3 bacterium]MCR4423066.1 hypothetical protein [candidate division WOR-3 bacterium]MDH7518405.1 hypothetical protein [bacterium]